MRRAFNRTPEPERPRPVVSKIQLEMLERQREKPAPGLNMEMRGQTSFLAQRQTREALEKEIKYVQERLRARRGRAREGMQRAIF